MLDDDVLLYVIRPTLKMIGMWSLEAEKLLLGTALIETNFSALKQKQGPALGFWQIEPATHSDVREHLAHVDYALCRKILWVCGFSAFPNDNELIYSIKYSCVIARVIYHRSTIPLPAIDDNEGFANLYKTVYNTSNGKAQYPRCLDIFKGIKDYSKETS